MMSGGVRDVEIPVCNVDLSTRTSCVHDPVTFWASHAVLIRACTVLRGRYNVCIL